MITSEELDVFINELLEGDKDDDRGCEEAPRISSKSSSRI